MSNTQETTCIEFNGEQIRRLLIGRWVELRNEVDPWPPKINLPVTVRGDFPFGVNAMAPPGIYEPRSNPHGALCVKATNGSWLGVKPGEFEWVCPLGYVDQVFSAECKFDVELAAISVEKAVDGWEWVRLFRVA